MFLLSDVIGTLKTKLTRSASILFTTDIYLALASIILVLSILSALMLNLVLPLSASLSMQDHLRICQVALRPVGCESKAMIPR